MLRPGVDDDRGLQLRIGEVAVVLGLAALCYHDLRDPARVLAWAFGDLPTLRLAHFRPWLALARGLVNLALVAAVVSAVSGGRAAERLRWATATFLVAAWLVLPALVQIELRLHVDEAPGNQATYQSRTHDGGVAQTEMAADALLAGRNPSALS